jgi:hypothetical protein
MDFSQLGLNLGVVAGIVGITQAIKRIVIKKRIEPRAVLLIPLALGAIGAAFLTIPWDWQAYGEKAISYAGVSCLVYMLGKGYIGGKK